MLWEALLFVISIVLMKGETRYATLSSQTKKIRDDWHPGSYYVEAIV